APLGSAATRRVGHRANALDDLSRLVKNRVAVEVVEVPPGRASLLGELVPFLIKRGERVAEEHAAGAFGRPLAPTEGGAGEELQPTLERWVRLEERLILQVH